jgi:Nuclease-related domain
MSDDGDLDPGTAGRSARREYARRRDSRERRTTPPPRGPARLLSALLGAGAEQRRQAARDRHWLTGADGEELVAGSLARRCPDVAVIHDRRLPGSRANIDHLAVAASGVHVIDAKRYRGKIEVRKPLFGRQTLRIAGRDRSSLVDGLSRQVAAAEAALAGIAPDVPVHGCFCFVTPEGLLADTGLPLVRTLAIKRLPALLPTHPRATAEPHWSGESGAVSPHPR